MTNKNKYERIQAINIDTGEIEGTIYKKADSNSEISLKVIHPGQEKAIKEKTENIEQISSYIKANEGRFFHLVYKYSFPLMVELQEKYPGTKADIHIIRFIILGTYLTFGNRLFDDNGNEIKKSSLSKIWDTTSRNSINETFEALKECGYIKVNERGFIMINEDKLNKGSIKDFKKLRGKDKDLTYTRIFSENLQKIYEDTPAKQRKHLGVLFKILPFINYKHNVLCSNPTEEEETKINVMSWKELALLCGYDVSQSSRLKRDLKKLKIYDNEVIGQFETNSGTCIVINPKVYYAGNDVNDVMNLYAMFKMCAKK